MQDKEAALNVSARADRRGGPGIFRITATIRQGKTPQEVEGLIEEEISKLYSQPVTDKELQRARIAMRRSAENRLTALSRAQALADAAAVYNDPNRVNTEIPAELAVTAADIQKAAKDLLVQRIAWWWSRSPQARDAAADGEASNEIGIRIAAFSRLRLPWRKSLRDRRVFAAWSG